MGKRLAPALFASLFLMLGLSGAASAQSTTNPYPTTGDTNGASPNVTLTWTAGAQAATTNGNDVYLGTSLTAVTNATHASPEWQGTQTPASFVCNNLTAGQTYYWRVDALNPGVSPYVWTGTVWSFTVFNGTGQPAGFANGYAVWIGDSVTQINPGSAPGSYPTPAAAISMAINESSGFQIGIVPATGRRLDHVAVTAGNLTSGSNTIPASSISWLLVGFMQYNSGNYADILLPVTNFNMTAGAGCAGVMVTVNTPLSTPPGTYTGNVTLQTDSGISTVIPLTVTVWNITLPSGPGHSGNSFSLIATEKNWASDAEFQSYGDLMLQYRLNPDDIYGHYYSGNLWNVADLQHFVSGGMTKFCICKADNFVSTGGVVDPGLVSWMNALPSNLANIAYFYGYDEKDPPTFGGLGTGFGALASLFPSIPRDTTARVYLPPWANPLSDMATYSISGIIANDSAYTYADGQTIRSHGYTYGSYHDGEGVAPSSGNEMYPRTTFWTQYDQKSDGFLYYSVDDWYNATSPPPVVLNGTPFVTGHTWAGDEPNGLAELIYVGPSGPLASLRMYNCRDGIEDYEYIYQLTQKINDVEVGREMSEYVTGVQPASGAGSATTVVATLQSTRAAIAGWLTQPFLAKSPSPSHRSVGNSTASQLSWQCDFPAQVNSFDVYLGTDYNGVLNATNASTQFMGNQPVTDTTFNPGTLLDNTEYYWRIDEWVGGQVYKGYVFKFNCSFGLCGWWNFDEASGTTALDGSGRGLNGTLSAGVARVSPGAAGSGALLFAGTGSVSIPAAALSTVSQQVSVAFWQYGAPAQPQSEVTFEALTASGSVVIRGRVPDSDGSVHFDAGGTDTVSVPIPLWLVKDTWNHWAFTKNCTTGTMKVYLNGALLATATGTTQTLGGAVGLTIGSKASGAQGYEGTLDEFRLYDTELQASDVTTLYTSYVTANLPPLPPGGDTYTYFTGGQILMGHWSFDELTGTTVRDDSNFHNDGTLHNANQTRTAGIIGGSLLFNGTSDYVNIPANNLTIPGRALTLSLWTYGDASLPNAALNYGSVALNAVRSDGSTAFLVSLPANNGSIFYRGGGDSGPDTHESGVAAANMYKGQWNHWVFCRDAQGYVYMYCNGALFYTDGNYGTDAIGTIATFRIGTGCTGGPASCYYKGMIDEVRMYNYSLSATQVASLYNSDLTKFAGQIGRWKFDENTGSTTADATPFNHAGTITAAAWVNGRIGSALNFNGSTGNVAIAAAALAPLDRKVTVTFWQYGAATLPSTNYILEALDASGGATLRAGVPGPGGNVFFDSGFGGASQTDEAAGAAGSANYQNQWNHWALTKNAYTGQMEVYLNGLPWQAAAARYRPITPAASFKIGSRADGSATSAGTIDDVRIYNLELNPTDIWNIYVDCPPLPNPMTWAVPPYATGPNSIAMVATTATHPNGVSYFFHCTAGGGHDSGWQSSSSYTDTGLTPLTQYTYEVMARENGALEQTGYSPALSATTFGATLWNLTVQSTPVTGISITGSSPGTTNYGPVSVYDQSTVNLTAPATTTSGGSLYNFVNWTVNSVNQPAGQTNLAFTIGANSTVVAVYAEQTWTVNVQSTPAAGAVVTSTTGSGGTTNYQLTVDDDSSVNLTAPTTFTSGGSGGTHYNFAYWTLNGVNQPAGQAGLTFTVNAGATAIAVYTVQTWTLTVQSTPTGAAVTGSSPGTTNYAATVNDNTAVSLTAPASFTSGGGGSLYNFAYWTLNGVNQTAGQANLSFTIGGAATAVAVYTEQTWSLTIQSTPATGAAITGSSPGSTNYAATVNDNSSVTLTAPATFTSGGGGTHYNFSCWTLNGVNQTAGQTLLSFTINASATAVAVYTVQTWTLTVQSIPTGDAITGSSPGTTNYTAAVNDNSSVNLTAPASFTSGGGGGGSLYNFAYWTLNGINQPAGQTNLSFTITANATAVAVYTEQTWSLTVQSTPVTGAAITGSSPGTTNYAATVNDHSSVSLTAPTSFVSGGAHYNFSYWTLNGSNQTAGQTALAFTITANATAVAVYTEQTWSLTVQSTPVTGAAITGSSAGTTNYVATVNDNSSVSLTAPTSFVSGGAHYNFAHWTLNSVNQTAGQTALAFTITANATAVAVYTEQTWSLTVQSTPVTGVAITGTPTGVGGTTNYSPSALNDNTAVTLTAPGDFVSGTTTYVFEWWTLNGAQQASWQTGLSFNISSNTTVVAVYAALPTTSLVQWLRSDKGVTQSANLVSEWADQTSSGNNATQGTKADKPTLTSSVLNGQPGLLFNGSTDFLTVASSTSINNASFTQKSIIVVFKTGSSVTSNQIIWEQGNGTRGINIYIYSTGHLYVNAFESSWGPKFLSSSAALSPNTSYYVELIFNEPSGTISGYLNAVSMGTSPTGVGTMTATTAASSLGENRGSTKYHAGTWSTAGEPFNGYIIEVLHYNVALSTTNRNLVEEYIHFRYGL